MDLVQLFTRIEGRINRQPYILASLAIILIGIVGEIFVYALEIPTLSYVLYAVVLWPSFALNVKRAHDRDRPTWWIVLFFAWALLLNALQFSGYGGTEDDPSLLFLVLGIPWFVFMLALFIDLTFLRGTNVANRYGPDPLVTG
jgi:uncharacterized membrane protein YhaH (DUF805 family)